MDNLIFFIGFGSDRGRRSEELFNRAANSLSINVIGRFHFRIFVKDIFSFVEQQEKFIRDAKNPDNGITLIYGDDSCSQGFKKSM